MHAVPHLAQNPGDASGSLDQKSAKDCGVTRVHVVSVDITHGARFAASIYMHVLSLPMYWPIILCSCMCFFIFCCRHWRKKAMYVRVGDRRICHSAAQ